MTKTFKALDNNNYMSTKGSAYIAAGLFVVMLGTTNIPTPKTNNTYVSSSPSIGESNTLSSLPKPQLQFSEESFSSEHHTKTFLTSLYTNLIENQQPLGKEFETILHENLWDLYQD